MSKIKIPVEAEFDFEEIFDERYSKVDKREFLLLYISSLEDLDLYNELRERGADMEELEETYNINN